jgi:AbrB family looped-hinge helix DNA binding protein
METTKLSSKGQIVLPSSIRTARNWRAGIEFLVEETPEGVLLRPLKPFAATRVEDVFGSAGYAGPSKSVEEMNAVIAAEARKRAGR